jgi:hypothetical protein
MILHPLLLLAAKQAQLLDLKPRSDLSTMASIFKNFISFVAKSTVTLMSAMLPFVLSFIMTSFSHPPIYFSFFVSIGISCLFDYVTLHNLYENWTVCMTTDQIDLA